MEDSMEDELNNGNIENIEDEVLVSGKSYGELSHKDRRDLLLARIDSMDPDEDFDPYEPIRKRIEVETKKTSFLSNILRIFGI